MSAEEWGWLASLGEDADAGWGTRLAERKARALMNTAAWQKRLRRIVAEMEDFARMGTGPMGRDANVQMRRGYVWMQENAAAIDVAIRETDSGATQQIKRVAAQYQREFQQHRQEVQ
ncbi:MAG: hypothetical protein JXQ29_16430 [Planctomycetes bacterium]|nr:hypothetical protein [Planctomycetota bacterium]